MNCSRISISSGPKLEWWTKKKQSLHAMCFKLIYTTVRNHTSIFSMQVQEYFLFCPYCMFTPSPPWKIPSIMQQSSPHDCSPGVNSQVFPRYINTTVLILTAASSQVTLGSVILMTMTRLFVERRFSFLLWKTLLVEANGVGCGGVGSSAGSGSRDISVPRRGNRPTSLVRGLSEPTDTSLTAGGG